MHRVALLLRGASSQPSWRARVRFVQAVILSNRVKRWRLRRAVRHLHGPPRFRVGADEAVVLCMMRDAAEYVREFLEYYLNLDGVAHVVLADNGSQDDSVERARQYDRVTLVRQPLPYAIYGPTAHRFLFDRFGRNRWVLNVDIDEFFDYPRSHELSLRELIQYLQQYRYDAMVTQLLDLVSDRPISRGPGPGESLRDFYRFYDLSALIRDPYENFFGRRNELPDFPICTFWGGIREAWFGSHDLLTKHSLFFNGRGVRTPSTAHGVSHARIADVTGVVRHYKFLPVFAPQVDAWVQEGNHYNNSEKYRLYQAGLAQNPDPILKLPTSRELGRVDELLGTDFVFASERFLTWQPVHRATAPTAGATR